MHSEINSRSVSGSPKRRQNRFTSLIKALCLTTLLMQTTNAAPSNSVTTMYDGVSPDKYIQYLKFDGTNGVSIPLPDGTSLNTN